VFQLRAVLLNVIFPLYIPSKEHGCVSYRSHARQNLSHHKFLDCIILIPSYKDYRRTYLATITQRQASLTKVVACNTITTNPPWYLLKGNCKNLYRHCGSWTCNFEHKIYNVWNHDRHIYIYIRKKAPVCLPLAPGDLPKVGVTAWNLVVVLGWLGEMS
jgi:hypothetical protein